MGTERDGRQRPELQDQAVDPFVPLTPVETDDPAPWAHTAVHGRYPAGTDPKTALREVMTVFMERTDGTNALPWWTQAPYRWWHAGPAGMSRGDVLRPPAETGVVPLLDSDRTAVYVTSSRDEALMYAAQHVLGATDVQGNRIGPMPRLYEVSFDVEPQPDDTQPGSETSFRVPSAIVRRVEQPSRHELATVIGEIMQVHEAQLAARLVEAAEEAARDAADGAD